MIIADIRPVRAALPIGLLAAAGFLSSAGTRVIDPLLHVLANDFKVDVPTVSVVVAAFTLPYGLFQLLVGPIGDRVGKLRVMLTALICYAAATAGCALAPSLPALTLLRVAAGAASAGLIPVGLAYIGDAVPYAMRQVTLSRFLNGAVLAQVLAGPVGGMFGQYIGWRGVFLLLSACALGVATLMALGLRRLADPRGGGGGFSTRPYAELAQRPFARRLLVCATVDGLLLLGCFPFLAPYMREAFGLSYLSIGLVLSCFGLGALTYIRCARGLVARLGESGMVATGALVMSAALTLAMRSPSWVAFVPAELMLGFGFFTLHGVLLARATELLPQARATAVSSFAFMLFMGQSLGALLMGGLIGHLGYRAAFQLDAAAILVLGGLLWNLLRHGQQEVALKLAA